MEWQGTKTKEIVAYENKKQNKILTVGKRTEWSKRDEELQG